MWKLTLLTGIWTLAVVYAGWFGVLVWSDPGLMLYAGHALSLLFWGIPLLPLALLSAWLLNRWTGARVRMPWIFLAGWIALILLPGPSMPMARHVTGQPTTTTVTAYFWVVMILVSVVPTALTAAMWYATIASRRA